MIVIERKSERIKTQEMDVRSMASQLVYWCETLEGFERCFNEGDRLELWHLDIKGDKDRLIWIIREKPNQ